MAHGRDWPDSENEMCIDRLVMDAARKALKAVVEADGGMARYMSEDDDIGFRACCDVISYKPHEEDCYVMEAKRALAAMEGAA